RLEVDLFTLGQLELELLDEGRHVVVGDDFADPFLGFEGLGRHLHLHVLLDGDLARKPAPLASFTAINVGSLRGKNITPTGVDLYQTLRAGPTPATRTGDEDALVCERV